MWTPDEGMATEGRSGDNGSAEITLRLEDLLSIPGPLSDNDLLWEVLRDERVRILPAA